MLRELTEEEIAEGARLAAERRAFHEAHAQVARALRKRKLFRPKHCESCGLFNERIEGHHQDYSRPLDVVWLCTPCHRALHGELRTSKREAERAALAERMRIVL